MPTPYKGGYGVRYERKRYKSTSWRNNARKFIQRNFTANRVRNMQWWNNRKSPHKVGWTAKAATYGTKARAAQNRWRKEYFNKYGKVI